MKNKFLSRIGQWHTPPYLRKCLTSLNALILLFVMGLSVNVWGETYTISFVKGTSKTGTDINTPLPANASTMCQSGSDYIASFSSDAAYYNASGCGIRIAKSKGDGTFSVTLSDDIQAETVKEVIIYASAVASGNTLDVTPAGTVTTKTTFSSLSTYSASAQISSYAQSAISINGTLTSLTFGATSKKYVHLHQIDIITGDDPTGKDVTITAESELNLTFEESDGTINVTYGEDVADKEVNLFSDASCTTPFSGDWFDAELNSTTGNIDYIAEANTGAAREAYIQIYVLADDAETENTKVIKVTQEEYKEPTGTFAKFTEDLEEGDYVICVGTDAMKNSVTSNRLDYASVTVSSDKITNPDASVIWHIASVSEGVWSIFNVVYDSDKGGYAAGTGTKNQAGILAATTDVSTETKAQWTCAKVTNGYNFENVANKVSEVNSKLQKNGTYGFACYAAFSDIVLYKKEVPAVYSAITVDDNIENGSVSVTGAADLTSVASGTEITLGNTPDAGYTLGEYEVYKTGESATKVTITDGKFKMPAYGVTVSATFKTARTLTDIDINTDAVKKEYWVGDTFTSEGLVVTAHFDGDDDADVTEDAVITGYDMATAGNQTVTVSFTEGTTTKSDEYTIKVKTIANTEETAYTVAEAIALIDANPAGLATTEVYVKGIVSSIPTPWSSQFNNITYNISDNGETTGQQFQLYRCATNGAEVGDKVIAKGKMKKFNSTYEFDAGNTIVSIRRAAKLEWSAGAYTAELGLAEYDYPTLTKTPTTLTGVTYSSSNTDVATIDAAGVITLKAEGETTITASFAGDATYDAAEDATYILTVAAEVQRFTITYNSNGGSVIDPVENQTNLPNEFPTPTKDWKVFGGWYLDNETFENPAVANAPLTDNTTLFAKWNDPLSVAEMIALIPNANDNKSDIYGYGYIKKVDKIDNGAAIYWITDGTNDFEVYKGKNINNENFTDASELPVGNKVMIFGNIKNYQGTHEFDANNYLLHNEVVTTPVTGVSLDKTAATVYVGQTTTLVANILPTYATNKNVTWSSNKESVATVADGVVTGVAKGSATITVTTEDGNFTATCAVTVEELPIWATTYTSNVTVGTDKVRFSEDGEQYDAKKTGSGSSAGSTTITVPAGTYAIHFHAAGWNSENVTLAVKKGETVLGSFDIPKDAGMSNNSPFTLANDPAAEEYFMVNLSDITEETTITFVATSGKRFAIYGVNALAPAAITIDPASKDFGEVKQGFDAEQVFTLTPNAFATGTITAEIDGDNVFTASTIADNKVTVTFAPTEIKDYNATLIIKHDGTQMCTAALTGKGITPTTPEIVVSDDEIDFGKEKQDATITPQAVTVTLNYLDAATASIDDDTYFSIDKTDLVAGENTITISATASSVGPKSAVITITGEGATPKTIAVKMDVTSKWAGEYTSNVKVESDKVIIAEEEYEAVKAGTGKVAGSTTITVPEGAYALHFHAAGWNNEDVTLSVKNGDTELGPFDLYKDAGVTGNSPFTLQGENYDTDQYFYVEFDALEEETTFTFAATSGNRFVLYGVNQEGGVLPVLDHITIDGEATKLNYNTTDAFDPVGLTVNAVYTLKGVEQTPAVDVTDKVDWIFDPATFNEVGEGLSVTATASFTDGEVTKTADKVITGISVEEATPSISASKVNIEFGEVIQGATVEPIQSKITLKYIDEVSVTLSETTAFEIDKTSMTETDYLTISAVTTAEVGEYTATVTIKDLASETSKVLNLSITIKEAPQAESYTLVTDASTLKAGDIVVMAATKDNNTYVNGDLSGDYLANIEATIDNETLTSIGACEFVLGGEADAWTLTSTKGTLGATAVKKLTYDATKDNFVGTWTINIDEDNNATIAPAADDYGRFMYNTGSPRFLTYTSNTSATMLLPQLYRKPVYETIRENVTDGTIGTMCYEHNIVDIKGAVIYEPNYVDGNVLEFIEVPVDETVAGLPYIFVANGENDGKVQINFGTDEPEIDCEYKNRGLVGNIDNPNLYVSDPAYAIYQNQIRPANYTKVAVGRAYIENITVLYELEPIVTAAPRRRFSLGIERNMPTGFETIMMQKGMNKVIMNNQLYLIRDGKLFNAQGALVK